MAIIAMRAVTVMTFALSVTAVLMVIVMAMVAVTVMRLRPIACDLLHAEGPKLYVCKYVLNVGIGKLQVRHPHSRVGLRQFYGRRITSCSQRGWRANKLRKPVAFPSMCHGLEIRSQFSTVTDAVTRGASLDEERLTRQFLWSRAHVFGKLAGSAHWTVSPLRPHGTSRNNKRAEIAKGRVPVPLTSLIIVEHDPRIVLGQLAASLSQPIPDEMNVFRLAGQKKPARIIAKSPRMLFHFCRPYRSLDQS